MPVKLSFKDLRKVMAGKDLRKIFEFKNHSTTSGRSSRSKLFKYLRNTFHITDHSRIFRRSSRSKIIQGPSEDLREQISSKDLRDQISFKNLRKMLDIEDQSRIFGIKDHPKVLGRSSISQILQMFFGRSSRSKIIQGPSRNLRDPRSFKDLREMFENKYYSGTFQETSRINKVPRLLENTRIQRSFKDIPKFFKIFEIKDHSRRTSNVLSDTEVSSRDTDVIDISNVSVDNVCIWKFLIIENS